MKLKDVLGMVFIGTGAALGTVAYRLLGLQWYFAACIALMIGGLLIWSASRDKKIRDAMDEVPGDWGDRHYISGAHDTDDLDTGANDGDH